jgi:hypothetical protein
MQKTNSVGVALGKYAYAPFGGNAGTDRAHVGFSSEVMENDAGMVYYNYRYLHPFFRKVVEKRSNS